MTPSTRWLAYAWLFAATGCAKEPTATHATKTDAGPVTRSEAGMPPLHDCVGPGFETNAADQTVLHVSATVVDESGAPVPDMVAQACGVNVCVNGKTDQNGVVVIDTDTKEQKPAFKYGDGKTYAKFALSLGDGSSIDVDLGNQATVAFDPAADGAPLTAGTTASSRDVALDLPADMNPAKPDPIDFDTADLRKFRAALVPHAALPKAVDSSLGFELTVAMTPEGTELCPAAKLTVPNSPGWPAGAAVEVFLHGVDVTEEWAPYGGWAKVSDGEVSADGATITTAEGGGIPSLSVVGFRLAQ